MFLGYSKRVNDLSGQIFRPVTDMVKGRLFEDWNSGF